ncbi:MAG TPA: hypothetical protein PLE73_00080 [Spirochaetota bacterium]|nr:hypothetical protein [Spirochaetota bacterium]HOS38343.1 hypothetical protein [Spirochaetota bacterium]HPI21561.1 hypothetical protein [Spirochaetota bacterium]HPU89044.1 hypothetical protein [Spirochaetota bacterium]
MSGKDFEKTKSNIGVKNLDDHTKKDLFNKFVQAGGQVVSEKKRRGMTDFDRDKQRAYKTKIEEHKKKLGTRQPVGAVKSSPPSKKKPAASKGRDATGGGFFERLSIRFKLLFMGVTDFSILNLKPKFLNRINFEYRSALMEIQMVYLDVFKSNPVVSRAIIEDLDSVKPVYFELIERVSSIYERSIVDRILNNYTESHTVPLRLDLVQEHVTALLRRLVPIVAYQEQLQYAFDRAISMQMKLEKEKASVYSRKRKKAKNSVFVIYNRLYQELYWLFCGIQGRVLPLQGGELEELLGVTDEERVGNRVRADQPKEIELPEAGARETEEENAEAELPDHIKKGVEMMFQLDLARLRKDYDRADIFREASDNDKVLVTYLLMQEFDKEYSIILTTNKIKYNVVYSSGGKTDYRAVLSDTYNEMLKCLEGIRAYAESLATFAKAQRDKPTSNAQYIEYSKNLTSLEKEKIQAGRNAIASARMFMNKVSAELAEIVADMNGKQGIVDNPQDPLAFNAEIEGNKKLDKKKIYEAITLVYQYTAGFAYRLGFEGDLSGNLEFSDSDRSVRAAIADKSAGTNRKDRADKAAPDAATEGENPSVIKELDDLF